MSSTAESSDLNVDDLAPKEMVIGLPKEPGIEATTPSAVDVLEVNQKNDSAVTSEEANRVSKDKPAVHPITPYPPVYLPSYPGAYPPPAVYPPRNPYFDRGYYPPR